MTDRSRTLVSRDALMNADKTLVARLTVKAFDALQGFSGRKPEQLMALAAAFVLMCEAARKEPFDVFNAVKNLMVDETHCEQRDHRFAAMKYHVETELLHDA